jgi:hypothetical protein
MLETTPLIGPVPTFSQFYVGKTLLVNAAEISPGPEGQPGPWITGRTPPSTTTGVADLTAIFQDGTISLSPEAFSYGPTIIEVAANASTSEGGTTGIIFGYGYGQKTSDIHVTVGGQSAQVTAIAGIPFQPFPIQFLAFTVPAGAPGAGDDVTVTTPSGAATAAGSFHYASAVDFHSSAEPLQAGVFDPNRNVYYFTSPQQIAVLSKSTGAWLTPIPLPIIKSSSQPLAISLSPDGSKLAVSDYGTATIYLLSPDNPATVKSYAVPQTGVGNALTTPSGLAITDTGIIYYATTYVGGETGAITLHMLDTTTSTTKDIGPFFDAGTVLTRVLLSPDEGRVYSNISGFPIWVDTATGQMTISNSIIAPSGSVPDLAISADGKTLTTNGALTDAFLNPASLVAYTDREQFLPIPVVGQKLNQDGSLLFQPLAEGIDVIDCRTGRLLYRVEVPQGSAQVYDALVVNPIDSMVAIITTKGVALVDLGLLPNP